MENGLFVGHPTNADPMMILQLRPSTGLTSIDTSIYKFIEIRIRVPNPSRGIVSVYFRGQTGVFMPHKIDIRLFNDEYIHT